MSKRNFTLLIIALFVIILLVVAFLFSKQRTTTPGDNSGGTNFFSQFNPFRSNPKPGTVTTPGDNSGGTETPGGETAQTKLVKVSSMPIAGYTVFQKERLKEIPVVVPPPEPAPTLDANGNPVVQKKPAVTVKPTAPPTEFVPALRYVAKENGNIFQTFVDKLEERKFTVTVIPQIYEALFGNHGDVVVLRYLKGDDTTIQTFVGALPKEYLGADTTDNNEVKGYFLPDNIKDVSLSPETTKMFYLTENNVGSVGTILSFLDNKKTQVFTSPFTEWLSWWPSGGMITLTTKPASSAFGYVYGMTPGSSATFKKILGVVNGLTTLTSPDGKNILYGDSSLALVVYNTDARSTQLLGVRTLPEKCVWNKSSTTIYCAVPKIIDPVLYPDGWYQGEVSFEDQIWKIDPTTGNTTLLLDPAAVAGGEEIDGIKLMLDEGENYLFFVNKKDSYLWKLDLK